MLMKSCAKCGRLIPYGAAYCKDCQTVQDRTSQERRKEKKKEYDREYQKRKDPRYRSFYGSRKWKTLSQVAMQRDGYRCRKCGMALSSHRDDGSRVVLEVDHIQEIQTPEGWLKRFDLSNLQTLCSRCHNEKHGRFIKKVA